MRRKKLFILSVISVLLSSYVCIASMSVKEPLKAQKASKYAKKMKKICRDTASHSSYIIKATEKIDFDETVKPNVNVIKSPSDKKILKKQFENKKRAILNTMNELKYKKRDIANKINEFTSEIESLQDFALTEEEKKRNFYFSVSGGKTHSSNPNIAVSGMNIITEEIKEIAASLYPNAENQIDALHTKINPFKDSTIDLQWLSSAALGYHVGGNGRIEFEAISSEMKIQENSLSAEAASLYAIMFNLYYNPNIKNTPVAPYVGIGVGPVNFKFASKLQGKTNINLPWVAYQTKLGVAYFLIPELKISLGYRCFNIPVPVVDSITTHNVEVGLIFNF